MSTTARALPSDAGGRWRAGADGGTTVHDAVTGDPRTAVQGSPAALEAVSR